MFQVDRVARLREQQRREGAANSAIDPLPTLSSIPTSGFPDEDFLLEDDRANGELDNVAVAEALRRMKSDSTSPAHVSEPDIS
jgi:hypothetical protein